MTTAAENSTQPERESPPPPRAREPPTDDDPKRTTSMLGDFMREAAVLIAVFGWLDKAARNEPFLAGAWPVVTLGFATVALSIGIWLEQRRPRT